LPGRGVAHVGSFAYLVGKPTRKSSEAATAYTGNVGNNAKITMIDHLYRLLLFISGIFLINSCSLYQTEICNGNMYNIKYSNTYIKTSRYEGVIFSKYYIGFMFNQDRRIDLTLIQIDSAEQILRSGIMQINANQYNQGGDCPLIHKKLSRYKRQYFGYIDSNGDKIVYINCFWEKLPANNSWKTHEKVVLDGCSYFWSIKVNLNKKQLFELGVNGSA